MSEELKPVRCGCGGPVITTDYICVETTDEDDIPIVEPAYRVFCRQCGISTPFSYPSKHGAIKAWNRAMGATDNNILSKGRWINVDEGWSE